MCAQTTTADGCNAVLLWLGNVLSQQLHHTAHSQYGTVRLSRRHNYLSQVVLHHQCCTKQNGQSSMNAKTLDGKNLSPSVCLAHDHSYNTASEVPAQEPSYHLPATSCRYTKHSVCMMRKVGGGTCLHFSTRVPQHVCTQSACTTTERPAGGAFSADSTRIAPHQLTEPRHIVTHMC